MDKQIVTDYFKEQIRLIDKNLYKLSNQLKTKACENAKDRYDIERQLLTEHELRISNYIAERKAGCPTGTVTRDEDSMLFLKGFYKGATNVK